MAAKKKGLGRGLDAMIPKKQESEPAEKAEPKKKKATKEKEAPEGDGTTLVDITLVEPNKGQPRKYFDEEALQELSDSIAKFGVLQPLIVQKKKDFYEIIAGERRWRAAKMAKLKEIPVFIKDYSDQERMEISLIENIQRENLDPIEEAQAYKSLLEEFNLKQEDVAERVSKSRAAIANSLRLLKLDAEIQDMIIKQMITAGHARALLTVEDKEQRLSIAREVAEKKLSVRDLEKLVKKKADEAEKASKKDKKEVEQELIYADTAEKLKDILGTKVSVDHKDGKGRIIIDYYSRDEFERIVALLAGK
ncbi:MAG: ParB/RepB/Spo0J family partition protein [Eubacterium sp.]|nr:ParB/RepB/Spo0J family partition protein [Eubacterium sp.]